MNSQKTNAPAWKRFSVTYDIVTPESAECGDYEESGFVLESGTFRDAWSELGDYATYASAVDRIIINSEYHIDYATGAEESRTLHIPREISEASVRRLFRAVGVSGK